MIVLFVFIAIIAIIANIAFYVNIAIIAHYAPGAFFGIITIPCAIGM